MRKSISIPVGIWAYTGQTIIPHQKEILITFVTLQWQDRSHWAAASTIVRLQISLSPASLFHPFSTHLRIPLNLLNNSFFRVVQPPLVQPSPPPPPMNQQPRPGWNFDFIQAALQQD